MKQSFIEISIDNDVLKRNEIQQYNVRDSWI